MLKTSLPPSPSLLPPSHSKRLARHVDQYRHETYINSTCTRSCTRAHQHPTRPTVVPFLHSINSQQQLAPHKNKNKREGCCTFLRKGERTGHKGERTAYKGEAIRLQRYLMLPTTSTLMEPTRVKKVNR